MDSSTVICLEVVFFCHFRGVGAFCRFYFIFDAKIMLANSVHPDQTPNKLASNLGLHRLPLTLSRVYM